MSSSNSYNPPPPNLRIYCDCLQVVIPNCYNTISFPVNNSDVDITLYFVDKFGKEYLYETTTTSDGMALVDVDEFPNHLFNPYAGSFQVFYTLSGFPRSERGYFRNEYGFFPCLSVNVIDEIYVNAERLGAYNVDTNVFTCCCTKSIVPCGNYTIDPCFT